VTVTTHMKFISLKLVHKKRLPVKFACGTQMLARGTNEI